MKHTLTLLLAAALLAAGCSDDGAAITTAFGGGVTSSSAPVTDNTSAPVVTSAAATTAPSTTVSAAPGTSEVPQFPVVVASQAGEVTVSTRPERIAALSGTFVEMLFAMGAGDQVIAGDLFSNHPPEAADLIAIDSFNLNVEAVVDLDPDLVVLSFDPGEAVAAFQAVGIPTLLYGTAPDVEAVYDQIANLGAASGHLLEADALIDAMRSEIDAVVTEFGDRTSGLTYYHETDPSAFYTPNGQSFLGQLYGLLGMVSIADAAPDEFGSGFPLLSPEFIVQADPDVILLGGGTDPAAVPARPGWSSMTAVQEGRIVELDADLASRWGPRIVDLLRTVGDAVVEVLG